MKSVAGKILSHPSRCGRSRKKSESALFPVRQLDVLLASVVAPVPRLCSGEGDVWCRCARHRLRRWRALTFPVRLAPVQVQECRARDNALVERWRVEAGPEKPRGEE